LAHRQRDRACGAPWERARFGDSAAAVIRFQYAPEQPVISPLFFIETGSTEKMSHFFIGILNEIIQLMILKIALRICALLRRKTL
jgi:hypothetical protein